MQKHQVNKPDVPGKIESSLNDKLKQELETNRPRKQLRSAAKISSSPMSFSMMVDAQPQPPLSRQNSANNNNNNNNNNK